MLNRAEIHAAIQRQIVTRGARGFAVMAMRIFDLVYVLTPNSAQTKTMSVISRENLIDFDKFAYGSAESTLLFLIIAVFTILYIWIGQVRFEGGSR